MERDRTSRTAEVFFPLPLSTSALGESKLRAWESKQSLAPEQTPEREEAETGDRKWRRRQGFLGHRHCHSFPWGRMPSPRKLRKSQLGPAMGAVGPEPSTRMGRLCRRLLSWKTSYGSWPHIPLRVMAQTLGEIARSRKLRSFSTVVQLLSRTMGKKLGLTESSSHLPISAQTLGLSYFCSGWRRTPRYPGPSWYSVLVYPIVGQRGVPEPHPPQGQLDKG